MTPYMILSILLAIVIWQPSIDIVGLIAILMAFMLVIDSPVEKDDHD